MDGVSGRLRRFESWAPITNIRLKGGGGMLRSHVVYERSPEFLGDLTEDLFGERAVPQHTRTERLKDRALTTAENLIGPAALLVSLASGMALLVVVLLMGPFLSSLPLRWLGVDVWATRVSNGLSLLVLITMGVFLVVQLRQCYGQACVNVALGTRSERTK
jgi:hypothetical protein